MFHRQAPRQLAAPEPEEVRIDVKDVDHSYVEDAVAYLDRDLDVFHLPQESAARLGRKDDNGPDYLFMADWVVARAGVIQAAGKNTRVWTVPVNQLVTRPAAGTRPTG